MKKRKRKKDFTPNKIIKLTTKVLPIELIIEILMFLQDVTTFVNFRKVSKHYHKNLVKYECLVDTLTFYVRKDIKVLKIPSNSFNHVRRLDCHFFKEISDDY